MGFIGEEYSILVQLDCFRLQIMAVTERRQLVHPHAGENIHALRMQGACGGVVDKGK